MQPLEALVLDRRDLLSANRNILPGVTLGGYVSFCGQVWVWRPLWKQVWGSQVYPAVILRILRTTRAPWAQNPPSLLDCSLPVFPQRRANPLSSDDSPVRKGRDDLQNNWNSARGPNWKCAYALGFSEKKMDREGGEQALQSLEANTGMGVESRKVPPPAAQRRGLRNKVKDAGLTHRG